MKAPAFDQQHFPTLSVQEGYTAYAATYDEVKAQGLMDYPLLARIQTVVWEQLEAVADLACGTGRIGVWLKEHHPGPGRRRPYHFHGVVALTQLAAPEPSA